MSVLCLRLLRLQFGFEADRNKEEGGKEDRETKRDRERKRETERERQRRA